MKKLFFEHQKLTQDDITQLWSNCIFIFDTNVLLNFYRYSQTTGLQLQEAILYYKDRIWLPNQVGIEFFKNRLKVINEQHKNYDEPTKILNNLKESLARKKGHPFISEDLLKRFIDLSILIEDEFNKQKSLLSEQIHNDTVIDTIYSLFDNKTGKPYASEEIAKIYNEAIERFKNKVPPGFKDSEKSGFDKYSDYVIWRQMIDKSIEEKKSVIFISDDEKEDWLEISNGKKLGPLPTLIKEFQNKTQQRFHVYQTFKFLEYTYKERDIKIDQPAVDEVKEVGITITEKNDDLFLESKSITCVVKFFEPSENIIRLFTQELKSIGYQVEFYFLDENLVRLFVRVPFDDLVRRFKNKIEVFISEFKAELLSFEVRG